MLTYAKRSPDELGRWLSTEAGFISGLCSYDGAPIELEGYQLAFLQNHSRFRWITKSRQVGYSFIVALEAVARCHLRDGHTTIFCSYNLDDAKEKILIARQAYEELPLAYQKTLVVDSKTELVFEGAGQRRASRIISVPSKAPRGKKGDIVLDELAHYADDREVYKGSTALILRSRGQLTGCSTPLGRRGIFWEIAEQELRPYPHHTRQFVPWWLCRFFCLDVPRAAAEAPSMTTEERVRAFGRREIAEQLDSLALDDFQQELEGRFVDAATAYYPYELILPATSDDVPMVDDISDLPAPRGRLVAGYDVGRRHDLSELAVFEEFDGVFVCRLLRRFDNVPFHAQRDELRRLLNWAPIARLSIDETGLGMNLAEDLVRDYPQVVPEPFSQQSKERWCTDFKILLQQHRVLLPKDRDTVAQIHAIKRRVLPSGRVTFEAERTSRGGHADRFWAIALACQQERGQTGPTKLSARVFG